MTAQTSDTAGTSSTTAPRPLQVHSVYIRATAERIWQAITDPEWNGRYGYDTPSTFELRPGGVPFGAGPGHDRGRPADGLAAARHGRRRRGRRGGPAAPARADLAMAMDPRAAAEGFTRLTYRSPRAADPGSAG